ncbi:MAG: DnaD domain protein, partial [Lachnospiraceae bacterium]|nr:DnaD domain protein [Lachnospiraceae bacterium]
YDEDKNLVGIHLADLNTPNAKSARNLTLSSMPMEPAKQEEALEETVVNIPSIPAKTSDLAATVAPERTVEEAPAPSPYAKPSISADQLKEFKNRENTSQLIFIAESYLGRLLTPAEMKSILFFTDTLHFSEDLIDYLLQYCVDHGKKEFRYIEKVAINWAEEGITTPKEAKRFATKYDKSVYSIMNELGKSGSPTNKEMEFINRWTKEYGFTTDIIIEACERTVLATDKHRFEYAEGILSSWKRDNVHHKSDILKMDDLHQQQKQKKVTKTTSTNKFNQFTQNNYDFDALEKELLSN